MSSPSLPAHSHESSSDIDEAAKELIRVSKITISELELMEYHAYSDAAGIENGSETSSTETSAGETTSASSRINVTDNSALGLPRAVIRMACSKGTYVRAFARDLGEALGTGAHLDALQRSRSGIFRVENALSIEDAIHVFAPIVPKA
jgi:tRNA pseudouridine55 synthase